MWTLNFTDAYHIADYSILKDIRPCLSFINIPYVPLRVKKINLAILSQVLIDTIKLPQIRLIPQPNRLSTCLNSKFLFNCILTPFCKEGSLKYEAGICRALT